MVFSGKDFKVEFSLLGHGAVRVEMEVPPFRENLLPPSSKHYNGLFRLS
jgi:hypothetical protein